jgi:hypothetical protein
MRVLLFVSLAAGCWTSSVSEPVAPPATAEARPLRPVRMTSPAEHPSGSPSLVVRVLNLSVANNVITVGLSAGQNQGIEATWHAEVLDGQTDLPLPGGELEIVLVKPTVTVTRTQLTVPEIQKNTRVRVTPR